MRILSSIVAAATVFLTNVVADVNVIGPFALRITGKTNASIDGWALACHAGAATEGLCYVNGSAPVSGAEYEFYYNYTYYGNDTYPGAISYVYAYQGADGTSVHVPSFMKIYPNWASNIHVALFPPGLEDSTPVSLDFNTGFFYMASLFDDSLANATSELMGQLPETINVANFQLCYQWTGGYWYRSIGWLSGLPGTKAQNPSCWPVNLGIESLAA
ncbi:hypothetical protein GGR50DRAFT_73359 [Xylaria sp. CBS 124048]|nr:hypothetical protein GGR50DRAFT_73359 [Xylaria sp. CBS 124048]